MKERIEIDVMQIPEWSAKLLGLATLGMIYRILDDPKAERRLYERLAAREGTEEALAWLDERRKKRDAGEIHQSYSWIR